MANRREPSGITLGPMAILAALFAFGSRFVGKILTTALGWASTLLFVSHDRQLAVNFDREVNLPAINRVVPEGWAG